MNLDYTFFNSCMILLYVCMSQHNDYMCTGASVPEQDMFISK